jgi:quinoprotein glucose dehydrogenase
MPAEAPGRLPAEDYQAVLGYMLTLADIPVPAAASIADIVLVPDTERRERQADVGWPYIHGQLNANRYSAIDQINADNAANLEVEWRWKSGNIGPAPERRNVNMPIMHHGKLFFAAGITRNVIAVDASTGQMLWMWRPDEGERFAQAARKSSGKGVSYWEGEEGRRRVMVVTPGYYLVSLNAATGLPDPEFGNGGWVDLTVGLRRAEDRFLDIGLTAPPLVIGDVVVVGAAHRVGSRPPLARNVKGDVRGFDARTGEQLWTFHTIPEAGEPGYDTWLDGSAQYTGNAGVWAPMSADPQLGTVYLPVETATGDYYGGDRHGDNLYASSLVALDSLSGKMRWHFQLVHHDIWDWDIPTAPILADMPDGRKLVVQLTKQSVAYVFDRVTGQPVWPIEERAVPQTDVPGEWTSPTQPIPGKPPAYDRIGVTRDDFIDYTPEIRDEVRRVTADYRLGAFFQPPSLAEAADGTHGTLSLPFVTGGTNWEGGAYDPETGMLYAPSVTDVSMLALAHVPEASDIAYVDAGTVTPTVFGLPLAKPPLGRITAIDLNRGEIAWWIANGDTPDAYAENPKLAGVELPRTGKPTHAGLLVTKTLLFAGEGWGNDPVLAGAPVFRAYDKASGKIVAEIDLPGVQVGPPSTYLVGGRQFIAMMVMVPDEAAELVALALPR